jgi:hypothetical protein
VSNGEALVRNIQSTYESLNDLEPIIIIGMHRSGTSLMSRLMSDLGIHMGDWLSRDAESVFFQKINRSVYGRANAHWAEPETLLDALAAPDYVVKEANRIRKRLVGGRVRFGLPPLLAKNFGKSVWTGFDWSNLGAWGWKDPRTALVIPIWQQVFPRARWVHIYRDGIDVALSLYQRALRQQKKKLLKLYRFDFSKRTLEFEYCFQLWEIYLTAIERGLSTIGQSQIYTMKYEDLLREPAAELEKVLAFIEFGASRANLDRVCEQINRSRLDNSEAIAKYQALIDKLPASQWSDALGYSTREG